MNDGWREFIVGCSVESCVECTESLFLLGVESCVECTVIILVGCGKLC